MIKVERGDLINYIKNNIDICLNSIDVELNLDTRHESLGSTILVFPWIEATIKIDYSLFLDYQHRKNNRELGV